NELFLFLTPHIISSDDDIDKLRDAVKDGSDLLKQVNVGPHIQPKPDTLNAPSRPLIPPGARPPADSAKPDSSRLRLRPPASPDSTQIPRAPNDSLIVPKPAPPVDTLVAPRPAPDTLVAPRPPAIPPWR